MITTFIWQKAFKRQFFWVSFFISTLILITPLFSNVFAQTSPLSITITNPANGSQVSGIVVVTADTTPGTNGINRVVIQVNGSSICTDYSTPYSCNWTVPVGSGVSYTIKGWAIDNAGNKVSNSVTVTSAGGTPSPTPTLIPTSTPVPNPTPIPSLTLVPTPTPTLTPVPSPTPVPTAGDWSQVQKDPQRTGFTPETFNCVDTNNNPRACNFIKVWTYAFQPERIHPAAQAITYDDGSGQKVFVGTEMGKMYAINASTGVKNWSTQVGGAILNTAAAGNNKVYFGSSDGAVYALNSSDGTQAWKTYLYKGSVVTAQPRLGFSTAALLVDGKIMIGGRDKYFYGLDPNTGSLLWSYNAGSPILQTASWDSGKAFFGTMDMNVHAVNTLDGTQVWKKQLSGAAFKDYYPIVTGGKVIVKAQPRHTRLAGVRPGFPFFAMDTSTDPWYQQNHTLVATGSAVLAQNFMGVQDDVIASYNNNPAAFAKIKSLFLLDENTGVEGATVPHFDLQSLAGTVTPGCVDRDGKLVMPVKFIQSGWGRMDLSIGRFMDILFDDNFYTTNVPNGMGNDDENLAPTCTGNTVFGMHILESAANYTGAFNQDLRKWTNISQGATDKRMSNNNMHATNPASVSNGTVYHIMWNELIARRAQ